MPGPEAPSEHPTARRLVGLGLLTFAALMVAAVLHGIVGTLLSGQPLPVGDPSAEPEDCAQGLTQLEARFRARLGARFAEPPEAPAREWIDLVRPVQRDLDRLSARCRLDRADRPQTLALARAADELQAALRATGLLWERYRAGGRLHLRAARDALAAARELGADTSTPTASP